MVKAVGIIRFLSIVLFLGILALVYAYLPVMVSLIPDNGYTLQRESFFYYVVAIFVVVNILLSVLTKSLQPQFQKWDADFEAWFKMLTPVVNIYIVLLVGFIGVINNPTHISASSYAYLNFLGPILVLVWVIGMGYLSFTRVLKKV